MAFLTLPEFRIFLKMSRTLKGKIVAFGCDHAGWALKSALVAALQKLGAVILDYGCDVPEVRVDYPDYAAQVACAVSGKKAQIGILCCGTGIGMSIAANKFKGIRAAVIWDEESAKLAREHNDANVLCLGGRHFKPAAAVKAFEAFVNARPSQEPRHRNRLIKISKLEKNSP